MSDLDDLIATPVDTLDEQRRRLRMAASDPACPSPIAHLLRAAETALGVQDDLLQQAEHARQDLNQVRWALNHLREHTQAYLKAGDKPKKRQERSNMDVAAQHAADVLDGVDYVKAPFWEAPPRGSSASVLSQRYEAPLQHTDHPPQVWTTGCRACLVEGLGKLRNPAADA